MKRSCGREYPWSIQKSPSYRSKVADLNKHKSWSANVKVRTGTRIE